MKPSPIEEVKVHNLPMTGEQARKKNQAAKEKDAEKKVGIQGRGTG